MKFFGTDGIRGVAGKFPLDDRTIGAIGTAAAQVLKRQSAKPAVVIGRDTRISGAEISEMLARSFTKFGIEVFDVGVIPTPGISYLARSSECVAGVVVSASHNPYTDNGIKFFGHSGTKLPDTVEAEIEKLINKSLKAKKTAETVPKDARIFHKTENLLGIYRNFLSFSFPKSTNLKGVKLVIDCSNGSTSVIAKSVLETLGAEVTAINSSPDGKNINENCGSLHPETLARVVTEKNAACGLAFDGDGDRIVFVDETGQVRDGDYLLSIAAVHLKRKGKLRNNTLVTTVMANLGLIKAMEKQGISVSTTPVGDRYVSEEMAKKDAVIGGEQSGHIIFRDLLPTGDGILSSLQILGIMREQGAKLSKLCSIMKKYPQVLVNTKVPKKVPVSELPKTAKLIKSVESKLGDDGRTVIRYSGTENLLRVMIEGVNKDEITRFANEISASALNEIK
ncbi:MAG: phosphoglucosamine mutase [Endomicrobiales bacterium]|nr:phosphoglucosamine mutase [Endomicrobiales bacterium]